MYWFSKWLGCLERIRSTPTEKVACKLFPLPVHAPRTTYSFYAGSIISTALSFLSLYKDPIVRDNVSESHWAIEDLMGHDGQPEPVSLYLVVKPSDADRLRPLIRLMISQIVNRLTESMQFRDGASVGRVDPDAPPRTRRKPA